VLRSDHDTTLRVRLWGVTRSDNYDPSVTLTKLEFVDARTS